MAPHSLASATVSFGLVSIPVKLYSATQSSSDISFNMLHKSCGSRLKQQYICSTHNTVVTRDDTVKGYEFSKDRYVIFTPEELKALEEKATQTIEITEFIPQTKIDPIYFDKGYYLGPNKGGDKPYALLAKTMAQSGRVALAKYAARGKQYLVLLRPHGDALIMQQLKYQDEVRSLEDVPTGDMKLVKDQEMKLAMQLIDQITNDEFHPENYHDEVKDRVSAAIAKKVEGEDITQLPAESPKAEIIDLMEALKASLSGAKPPAKTAPAETEERKPAKRAAPRVKAAKASKG
jgi:DNA end-binding protein Ku